MSARTHTYLHKALVVVLTVWGFSCISPEFARVTKDYATLGFEANNAGLVTQVHGPPALAAGIQLGDCISLRYSPSPDLLAVFAGMGGLKYYLPGLEVNLRVANRCSEEDRAATRPVKLTTVIEHSTNTHRLLIVITGVLGICSILLGAALVWQRPNAMTWGFFSYVIWFNPGQTLVFYAELQNYPTLVLVQEVLQAAAQAAGYAGFIAFALRFPRNVVEARWRWLDKLLPGLAVVFFVMHLATFGTAFRHNVEWISQFTYVFVYIVPFVVWLILRERQKNQLPTDRQRTRWVYWACCIGLLPFIFADSNMSTSLWDRPVALVCSSVPDRLSLCEHNQLAESLLLALFSLNAIVPAAVYHAVLKHRVIDVRFALSRGLTLLLTSMILAFVLSEASVKLVTYLNNSTKSQILVFACLVPLIKVSFEYVHEWLNQVCDHLFFRRLHRAEHAMRSAGNRLHAAQSFDDIDHQLVQVPLASLDLSSAAVFRLGRGGVYRPKIEPVGWEGDRVADFPLESVKLKHLLQSGGALRLHGSDSANCHAADAAEPVLAIPVIAADELVAVALYGAHKTGEDISGDEQRIIEGLIEPAGGAYAGVEVNLLRRKIQALRGELRE